MAKDNPPNMEMIAERAGVTRPTVSYVLSGKWREKRISVATHDRIMKIVRQCGYQPHFSAQSLASRRTNTLGVIMPEMWNPFFGELVTYIERGIHNAGYRMILQVLELERDREERCLELVGRSVIDGLMFWTGDEELVRTLVAQFGKSKVPLVTLGFPINSGASCVAIDRRSAMIKATEYVIGLGHSAIGYVGEHEEVPCGAAKYEGFRTALSDNSIDYIPEFDFSCKPSCPQGYSLSREIVRMDRKPSAIVTTDDLIALGLMKGFRESDVDVPGNIALVGCDSIEAAEFAAVPLTSIAMPVKEMAQRAVEILVKLIQGKLKKSKQVLLEPELIIRQST